MLEAIEAWPLAAAIRRSVWAYPLLEIIHIAGFSALIGSLLTFELRVLGARTDVALAPLARLALPLAAAGFLIAALPGLVMFVSGATEFGRHPAFLAKIGLIVCAGVNAAAFHRRGGSARIDAVTRAQVALSLVLWIGVIAAGRLIAYL